MRLAEQTIELNFCAQAQELLGQRTFWFGLTQRQEARAGFDVASRIGGRLLILQFKASNEVLRSGARKVCVRCATAPVRVRATAISPKRSGSRRQNDAAGATRRRPSSQPLHQVLDAHDPDAVAAMGLIVPERQAQYWCHPAADLAVEPR